MFEEFVYYDLSSPSGLRRRKSIRSGKYGNRLIVKEHDVVGTKQKSGHWSMILNGKKYQCHRVVWYLFYGEIPEGFHLDHIDGNPSNNSIDNLRVVPRELNNRNKKMHRNNSSGVTGVYYNKMKCGDYWSACWRDIISDKQKHKHYSIKTYGYDLAFELACAKRKEMIDEMNNIGAGYSVRHGNN